MDVGQRPLRSSRMGERSWVEPELSKQSEPMASLIETFCYVVREKVDKSKIDFVTKKNG